LSPGAASSAGVTFGSGSRTTLTPGDGEAILRECPAVRDVAPCPHTGTGGLRQPELGSDLIYGSTPSYLDVRRTDHRRGRIFTDRDVLNVEQVCLLGRPWSASCFRVKHLGKDIRIKNVSFEAVRTSEARAPT
jgi:hypothetical protein